MRCEEARELFKSLYRERNFTEIGRLFATLKGAEKRCFEDGVMELPESEVSKLRQAVVEVLKKREGKEKPVKEELIKQILDDAIAVHLTKRNLKGYEFMRIFVRFRDGSQKSVKVKSIKEKDRIHNLYGVLKAYAILNKYRKP